MTTLASDNFTRADANPIGGNWTTEAGAVSPLQVRSNTAEATAMANANFAYWNAATFPANQWARMTFGPVNTVALCGGGLTLRSAKSNPRNLYGAQVRNTNGASIYSISKYVAGTATAIASSGVGGAVVGDVFELDVVGNVLTFFKNAAQILTVTDSTFASGAGAGMNIFSSTVAGDSRVTLWEAGDSPVAPSGGVVGWVNLHRHFVK